MSLTGSFFLGGTALLTLLTFVAVVWFWPRLSGRTPWQLAGRVGALALVSAMVLLTAVTQLNAAYLFFASWSDLEGALSGHIAQVALDRGGNATRAPDTAVRGTAAAVAAHVPALTQRAAAGGLLRYTVHGALSGLTGTVLVLLPSGYTSAAQAGQRYPVIEALHGYPSSPLNWVRRFDIGQAIYREVQSHTIRPVLVAMPGVEFPAGVDTEGVNGGSGTPQVETWLTQDVPNWVAQHFRVEQNGNSWATLGDSAGGYDAAMAAMLHPAQYGAGIVLGGYFTPDFGPFYEPFLPRSPLGRRYDLVRIAAHHPPPVALWLETSHADPVSYASSARFLRGAKPPLAVHAVILRNAGHRDSVWVALLPEALGWLGANVRGFHPIP